MDEILCPDEMKQILEFLEAEPSSGQDAPGPDIPAIRERLAVLVSSGRAKEAIRVHLTHEQVKLLSDKDVEKYAKRYETYVGSKTTDSLINSFIVLAMKLVGMVVKIKDIAAYQKELKEDYVLNNELSILAGNVALNNGKFLAAANATLITAKHIDFAPTKPSEQCPTSFEQLQTNGE